MSPTPLYNQAHYSPQRAPSYPSYPMLGAHVLSQLPNQHGPTAFYGGVPGGVPSVMPSFHPEQQHMPHIYGAPQSNPQNERPFRCDQCPQSFNRNHDLKRHKRIHLAVKPFPCGHCDKSFSRKDALKRHVLVKGCGKSSNHATIKDSSNNSPGSRTRSTPVGT
ncbi:hypothetical protein K470DRAFT_218799 [Piedraia hortae CBS 480.64]|uniref:C2H2-type domain-containing protein n=1 Tax=Piedraia hortae CBS 480.64 TaxID=1314780 RepID=A0A6A7BWD2_9PEZI|nr:hypothetical protein K470DRAFT_218799 [Piedraia hortae CBS 480.64]